MAQFSIISDIGSHIVNELRTILCPDIISIPDKITQVSPADKNLDFVLGLYLFDMIDSGEFPQVDMRPVDNNKLRYPPKSMTMYYMLFVNSKLTLASKATDEQRILGRTIQYFHDNPIIDYRKMPSAVDDDGQDMFITLENLKFEDKTKIWQAFSSPLQLAMYFRVAPVLISSERIVDVRRVVDAKLKVEISTP